MGIQAPAKVKYSIIQETIIREENCLKISKLCEIAGVSRSGYYNWRNGEPKRKARDLADEEDFKLILEAYRFRGYSKGARGIHMRLLHMKSVMNVKKIRRLMKKFNLKCPIRKVSLHRKMTMAAATNHTSPNIVDRNFKREPRKVLLTDITYLFFRRHKAACYLSIVLDVGTHEVLAYEVSESLKVDFVIETIDALIKKHGSSLDNETIVHSDRGCHYTSLAFIEKLRDAEFVQSMSRKGNCWDNAPIESFFGHMKDEIKDIIYDCDTFKDVLAVIDDWIDYYNNDRGQWELLKLSPVEYKEYVQTGKDPLMFYRNKATQ